MNKRFGRYTTLTVMGLILWTGCYRMTIQDAQSEIDPPKTFVEFREGGKWTHSVIGGIIPLRNGDVEKICGEQDFDTVHMRTTFLNSLMWGLTYNIYTPQAAVVICRETPADGAAEASAE